MDKSASSTPARDDEDHQGLAGGEAMAMATMMMKMMRMVIE